MGRFPKPCLDCKKLTAGDSRCQSCEQTFYNSPHQVQRREARAQHKASLYDRNYANRRKEIKATATVCYLCLKPYTLTDPLETDHLYPKLGNESPLLPAHRTCNNKKSNRALDELDISEFPGVTYALRLFPPTRF